MLDIQFIRDNVQLVKEKSAQKGYKVNIDRLLELDVQRRARETQIGELRRRRNELAEQLKGGRPNDEQVADGKRLKEEIAARESESKGIDEEFTELLKKVPNMPTDDVPVGTSENENVVAKTWGEPIQFDFEPKAHWQIAEARGWLDKERAAKVAGSRFAYLKGELVKLQLAIIQFTIDQITDEKVLQKIIETNDLQVSSRPFIPVLPPLMIRTDLYDAMDRLEPREDRYKIDGEELWLQGSAEHVLGSMHADEILSETDLPLRYLGYATSFRKEAGAYGKDTEGVFRLHQFDKLEMESFTTAADGLQEHLFMVAIQEYLLQQLGIPYQVIQKCTADIGKPNARGIDMNAWLPSQNAYRETHTADYMTDYQARRLKTRVRRNDGAVELIHTNDATAFALSRTPIAIVENYQTADGHVKIPAALQPYMGGKVEI